MLQLKVGKTLLLLRNLGYIRITFVTVEVLNRIQTQPGSSQKNVTIPIHSKITPLTTSHFFCRFNLTLLPVANELRQELDERPRRPARHALAQVALVAAVRPDDVVGVEVQPVAARHELVEKGGDLARAASAPVAPADRLRVDVVVVPDVLAVVVPEGQPPDAVAGVHGGGHHVLPERFGIAKDAAGGRAQGRIHACVVFMGTWFYW